LLCVVGLHKTEKVEKLLLCRSDLVVQEEEQ
jgi:hypothetical protein